MTNDERFRDGDDSEFDDRPGPAGRSGPSIWLILFVLLAAATAVFIVQNGETVPTEFLWLDGQFRFWVTIVVSVAAGIVLDRLILTWWRRSRRKD